MILLLLKSKRITTAELLNPDLNDLRVTENLAIALGLKSRCQFFNGILDNAEYIPASFDLIICISVLEHIPEDNNALKVIWSLLTPGGKLIMTLPCMTQPLEQYISINPYDVLEPGENGYTFWQRYYDSERLETQIYNITGKPTYIAVYGEKMCGSFFRNASMKRLFGLSYPFWREPYMMAREYKYFSSIDELPGEGVVVLQFLKKGEYDE
jgi:SAM-dependent methyltransferase